MWWAMPGRYNFLGEAILKDLPPRSLYPNSLSVKLVEQWTVRNAGSESVDDEKETAIALSNGAPLPRLSDSAH